MPNSSDELTGEIVLPVADAGNLDASTGDFLQNRSDHVNIFVGPDRQKFCLPRHILVEKSDYFRACLSLNFIEGRIREVSLEAEDPATFQHIVEAMTTGRVMFEEILLDASSEPGVIDTKLQNYFRYFELETYLFIKTRPNRLVREQFEHDLQFCLPHLQPSHIQLIWNGPLVHSFIKRSVAILLARAWIVEQDEFTLLQTMRDKPEFGKSLRNYREFLREDLFMHPRWNHSEMREEFAAYVKGLGALMLIRYIEVQKRRFPALVESMGLL